jgi:elongation factor P hydroxylase
MGAQEMMAETGEVGHRSVRLEQVFAQCFKEEFNTSLKGGYAEPLYLPPGESGSSGCIQYRADYFASALHEVAHWCIAGVDRRALTDYGYWYAPDGRDAGQQSVFEDVEYQPQALEWFFARACGFKFRVSVDNIDIHRGAIPDTRLFKARILTQAEVWQSTGLPHRAQVYFNALSAEFGISNTLDSLDFSLAELD